MASSADLERAALGVAEMPNTPGSVIPDIPPPMGVSPIPAVELAMAVGSTAIQIDMQRVYLKPSRIHAFGAQRHRTVAAYLTPVSFTTSGLPELGSVAVSCTD